MSNRWVLLAFGAAVIASGASADAKPGFYFGAGVGGSQVSVTNWDHNNNDNCCCCGDYGEETSDGDSAFSVHAGYRFMPYLAVEVGYVDSGNPEWNENQVYVPRLNDVFYNQVDFEKLDAAEVSVLGILPFLNIWEAYLRLGAAYWSADTNQLLVRRFDGAPFRRSFNESDTGFLFGIGVGASLTPHWHLRFEFQSYTTDEDLVNSNGDASTDSMLFEVQYRLRG